MDTGPAYKACYEHSLNGIFLTIANGSILAANPAACELLGMAEKEICASNISELINTEDPNFKRCINARDQTGKARGRLTFKCKNGKWLLCEVNTSVFINARGETQTNIIFNDITINLLAEQKATEAEFQHKQLFGTQKNKLPATDGDFNEERYRVMVENSYDAVLLLDENLITIYRSPSTKHVMGFTDEERLGKSYLELTHPDDLPKIKGLQQIVVNNPGISIPITVRAKHSNGHYLWFMGVATNLLHKKSVNGIVVNLRDISERKKAEDALQKLSNKLLLATRAANTCIWDWDIINNNIHWDDAMCKLYEINPDEFQGKFQTWYNCLHPDDIQKQKEELDAAVQGLKDFDTDFRIILPDQSIRYIRAIALVERDKSGKALRMIGNNWDISELKLALIEKEKIMAELVRRNNELEEFTYALSHNLRAPVANIIGLSDMLFEHDADAETALTIKNGLNVSIKKVDDIILKMNDVLKDRQQL